MSWFVAWVTIDQQRIEQKKHGIFPCKTIKESAEIPIDTISFGKKAMSYYSNCFDHLFFKVGFSLAYFDDSDNCKDFSDSGFMWTSLFGGLRLCQYHSKV